jgi:uncharacterized RDD family membrane protein YckC
VVALTDRVNQVNRVGELIEGVKRKRRVLVSPEGANLDVMLASRGERLAAFLLDMLFLICAIILLYLLSIPLFFSRANIPVGITLILFIAFVVRNMYFLHFELAWQGQTPGKKICKLRVINRYGGALAPSAVFARNLTREVEVFLPLGLFMSLDPGGGALRQLALLGWAAAITSLPFFNRDHMRAGDLIGGTWVIFMPRRALLDDLSAGHEDRPKGYAFTREQLTVYGAFELQVLEELLRRPPSESADRLLANVCGKIRNKTGREEAIPQSDIRRFLNDFYAAQRAELERGQLFGRYRADKTDAGENISGKP